MNEDLRRNKMIIGDKDPETNELKCPCGKKATYLCGGKECYIALCDECRSKEKSDEEIVKHGEGGK